MAVQFREVLFRNDNNIDVTLTVEAPIGTTVSGPQTVPAQTNVTVTPNVRNCSSVRFIAADPTHGEVRQTFAVAPPTVGRPAFLDRVRTVYTIGNFEGAL